MRTAIDYILDTVDRWPDAIVALLIIGASLGLMAAGGYVEWLIFTEVL